MNKGTDFLFMKKLLKKGSEQRDNTQLHFKFY